MSDLARWSYFSLFFIYFFSYPSPKEFYSMENKNIDRIFYQITQLFFQLFKKNCGVFNQFPTFLLSNITSVSVISRYCQNYLLACVVVALTHGIKNCNPKKIQGTQRGRINGRSLGQGICVCQCVCLYQSCGFINYIIFIFVEFLMKLGTGRDLKFGSHQAVLGDFCCLQLKRKRIRPSPLFS